MLVLTGAANHNATGSEIANTLVGNPGSNLLDGMDGNDVLIGGLGGDVLIGGAGIELVSYGDNYGQVFVSLWDGVGYGNAAYGNTYSGIENVRGSMFNDYVLGNAGANLLEGGAGHDLLIGALAVDVFVGGDGRDTVSSADNFGQVFVNLRGRVGHYNAAEGDTDDGIENIICSIFADTLVGGATAIARNGGLGADWLIGAIGADNFVFAHAIGGGNLDIIADFEVGIDVIQLDSVNWGLGAGTSLAGFFGTGASSMIAGVYLVYDPVSGLLAYNPDSNGAGDAIAFAQLSAGLSLSEASFLVAWITPLKGERNLLVDASCR